MKSWRIVLPVLVVLVVVGYALATRTTPTTSEMQDTTAVPQAVPPESGMMTGEKPVDTGASTGDAEADAIVTQAAADAALEANTMQDNDATLNAEGGDAELFTGDYYAQ